MGTAAGLALLSSGFCVVCRGKHARCLPSHSRRQPAELEGVLFVTGCGCVYAEMLQKLQADGS